MDIDSDESTSMIVEPAASHPVFANLTKPEKSNKFQKRVGAKTAKKL